MNFIRPELRAALWHWREPIFAGLLLLWSIYLFLKPGLVAPLFGALIGLFALGFLMVSVRRNLFRTGSGGPGVVQLDEGKINYFGPFYGGAVSLNDLIQIDLGQTADGKKIWYLHHTEGAALVVPAAAKGAAKLFDAFSGLPGIDQNLIVRATRSELSTQVTLWQRAGRVDLTP